MSAPNDAALSAPLTEAAFGARPVQADPALIDAYFRKVTSYQGDRVTAASRSARRAWTAAAGAGVLAACGCLAAATLATRPAPDPIVLRVDGTTGMVDRVYDVDGGTMTATEAEQRHYLWQYVRLREGYSFNEAQFNFDTVTLMSTPDVQAQYAEAFRGSNPQSPQIVLGRSGQAVVSWVSTAFVGPKLAQVRYVLTARKGETLLPRQNMVATIGFAFAPGGLTGRAINVNPRGFLVTSYHVDQENAQ